MKSIVVCSLVLTVVAACGGDSRGPSQTTAPSAVRAQMPLGSTNPCWGGTYPGDLPGLGIPESEVLVDIETNDMYDSVCIEARIGQYGERWPEGMGDRLVRASDL